MTIVASSAGDLKVVERLRGAIVGAYKVGKSWTLATAPDPVLFLDVDQRSASLAGKPGVFTLTPYDPPGIGMQPTIYSDVLDLVAKLEQTRVLKDISPTFASNLSVKTLVLDSIQSMSRAILKYNMYTNPKELARKINIGGQTLYFPNGWDTWNSDMECMEQLIARMIAIPDIDFWITFHEMDDNGVVDTFPGRHRSIIRYFNEVWRITRKQTVPEAQLMPTYNFTACTTLVGAPGVVSNPNIKDLVAKYGKRS